MAIIYPNKTNTKQLAFTTLLNTKIQFKTGKIRQKDQGEVTKKKITFGKYCNDFIKL